MSGVSGGGVMMLGCCMCVWWGDREEWEMSDSIFWHVVRIKNIHVKCMYNICTFEGWMDGTLCNTRSPAVVKTLCLHVTIIILITMYLYHTSTTTNPFCYYFFKQKNISMWKFFSLHIFVFPNLSSSLCSSSLHFFLLWSISHFKRFHVTCIRT